MKSIELLPAFWLEDDLFNLLNDLRPKVLMSHRPAGKKLHDELIHNQQLFFSFLKLEDDNIVETMEGRSVNQVV